MSAVQKLTAIIVDEGSERTVKLDGRAAWMLRKLISVGPRGLTTAELPPGMRISHFVFLLRREGFEIEMLREPHGGGYPGSHGRYTLRSTVRIVETEKVAA